MQSDFPIPLTAFVALALIGIGIGLRRPITLRRPAPLMVLAFLLCVGFFPLLLMFCYGKTSYERDADAIVVFGARAYADGRPSHALRDRVITACDLYSRRRATTLILSGGPIWWRAVASTSRRWASWSASVCWCRIRRAGTTRMR